MSKTQQDTVMSDEQIKELYDQIQRANPETPADIKYEFARACIKAGIKEAVGWIKSHQLIKPDDDSVTRFEPFYQIEEAELKEWGIRGG